MKRQRKIRLDNIYRVMLYVLPGILCFSYYPIIKFGASESMNFELSLPLIWLVLFDVVALVLMLQKKKFFCKINKKWLWLLFPIFVTISVLWSLNFVRGVLTAGILWLIYFAGYAMWQLRSILTDVGFRKVFWKVFFGSYLVVCTWCLIQCVMDLAGVSREISLLCEGCTYKMFGFPHPNGFAIEPQFMGNLLIAPAVVSGWLMINDVESKQKWKHALLFLVFSIGIFLTFSRGAIYSFAVAMIFLTTFEAVRQKSWKVCKTFVVAIVAFLFTLNMQGVMAQLSPTNDTYASGVAKVLNHLSLGIIDIRSNEHGNIAPAEEKEAAVTEEPETKEAVFDGYVVESTETRVKLSDAAVKVWKNNFGNMMIGVGLGGAGQALYVNGLSSSPKEIVQNEYASLLVEIGLVGIALFVLTVVLITHVMLRNEVTSMLITLVVAYSITLLFFAGLPNALHIYLLPALFITLYGRNSYRK